MRTIDELGNEIDYLKNTIACLKGENAALKAELAQQTHNSKSMPLICECGSKKPPIISYECPDCHGEVTN